MRNTVTIDCFPESVKRYRHGYAVVAVDVVRATTSAITAVAAGRRCFPVATPAAAAELAARLGNPLFAGEQSGLTPPGFDLNNSPAQLALRTDIERPLILLSSSGTRLCCEAAQCDISFIACLRNYISAARYLATHCPAVVLVGAGSQNEFREEDQMCCAWIAQYLLDVGYCPDRDTLNIVKHWTGKPVDAWIGNKSAAYLRNSGQLADLDFILAHVADLNAVFPLINGEVAMIHEALPLSAPAQRAEKEL
jgi:2-phosphosulfolactate phosphatase